MTLARGLENDPPVVPAMSSLVGLRRCMLASIAAQAVSGAASTCALPDSRVDIFSPMRRRFSSATGKSDVTEEASHAKGWLNDLPDEAKKAWKAAFEDLTMHRERRRS